MTNSGLKEFIKKKSYFLYFGGLFYIYLFIIEAFINFMTVIVKQKIIMVLTLTLIKVRTIMYS